MTVVPELPDFRPLQLSDKENLAKSLSTYPAETSEINFTNLFAWSDSHPVSVSRIGDTLLFWRGPAERGVLLPPVGNLNPEGIKQALKWAETMGGKPEFGRVGPQTKRMLLTAQPELKAMEDRDNADYVYRQKDLAELSGRNYDGKRNLIKKFNKTVDAKYRPISSSSIPDIADAQAFWCDIRECSIHSDLEAENKAVARILENWDSLDVFGGALWAEEKAVAFAIGEFLATGVAVVHVEKGDTTYPGVYQAINQAFCNEALSGYEYVNREQDLGVEGLRKAKMSYQPEQILMKYTIGL